MSNIADIIVRELNFPITTLEIFRCLSGYSNFFFLDSALNKNPYSKHSFFGINPFLIIKSIGSKTFVKDQEGECEYSGDPFQHLETYLDRYKVEKPDDLKDNLNFSFLGGAVGYLSYDLCLHLEELPDTTKDDLHFPTMYFGFYDTFLVFDHSNNSCFCISINLNKSDKKVIREAGFSLNANKKIETLIKLLKTGSENQGVEGTEGTAIKSNNPNLLINRDSINSKEKISSNFAKDEYIRSIEKAKEYILNGDIYQVNLSQRFHTKTHFSPVDLYERLRQFNPAPYSSFMNFDEHYIMSSSPEMFISVTHDIKTKDGKQKYRVQTRPIKGTRPRCKDAIKDAKLKQELLESKKDDAELTMIVDLERNDLGRVCEYGSIKVVEKKVLESYAEVHHLVATVEGDMNCNNSVINLIKALFPGGSITGAPKIRAMEIIDELEKTKRSVYTGAIGYISFDGCVDLSIAIRIILMKDKEVYFQVGSGIVADSDPLNEYEETLHKASALIKALGSDD